MSSILVVGIACIDIVHSLDEYPLEDGEYRSKNQITRIGGNGANMVQVLAQCQNVAHCALVYATVPHERDPFASMISKLLKENNIGDLGIVMNDEGSSIPMSVILQVGESRTIIHNRNLSEVPFDQFSRNFSPHYSWVHFEGRNAVELTKMIDLCKRFGVKVSVEMEKHRQPTCDDAASMADVLIFSRPFIKNSGYDNATTFLEYQLANKFAGKILVATWGADGAFYCTSETQSVQHVQARQTTSLVDTIGAGDTFQAVLVAALARNINIHEAVRKACDAATSKCETQGLHNLALP